MEVLLSRLSYRLYELESYCLSYEISPVESLIDINDELDWLSDNASDQFELMSARQLLGSFSALVLNLQQNHSPFNIYFRDLFLEYIDLIRQLILEQNFNLSNTPNLIKKEPQIELLEKKVGQIQTEMRLTKCELGAFEAELDQENADWLNILMDFIERFSRVGEYSFEGGLNYKFNLSRDDTTFINRNNASALLKIGVKTAQSLVWMKRNFNNFQWFPVDSVAEKKDINLIPYFRGFRHANAIMQWRDRKRFNYLYYYKELESAYLNFQGISLERVAERLKVMLGISIVVLPRQSDLHVNSRIVSSLLQDMSIAIRSISVLPHSSFTLFVHDVAANSKLSIIMGVMSDRKLISDFNHSFKNLVLTLPIDLDVLEHKLWSMDFGDERICVPDEKFHSIQSCKNAVLSLPDNEPFVKIEFEGVGLIDVFVTNNEDLSYEKEKSVILVDELGVISGFLVSEIVSECHAYKTPSSGIGSKIKMLWSLENADVIAEINPLAYLDSNNKQKVRQSEVVVDTSGWIALIAGIRIFISVEVVEKHLTVSMTDTFHIAYSEFSLVKIEGRCCPFLDLATKPALSLLLLSWQGESVCLSINSIYYEKNLDTLKQEIENVERIDLCDIPQAFENEYEGVLYVIDTQCLDRFFDK